MIKNRRFEFSYNWNGKLDNNAFTTLRLHNPEKHRVGEVGEIWLQKGKAWEQRDNAEIMAVVPMLSSQLSPFIAYLDTGYSVKQAQEIIRRMYKQEDPYLDLILLKYIRPAKKKSHAAEIEFPEEPEIISQLKMEVLLPIFN